MKKEDKIYCINNLSSAVISNLLTRFPKQDCIELFMSFYSSNTYKKLCDIETGLWAEGPDSACCRQHQFEHRRRVRAEREH